MKINKLIYSINFDKKSRSLKNIKYVIFHYTGMISERKSIDRLLNKNSKVSCHYFIKLNGEIIRMVPDKYVAWHAGKSCWKKDKNLNNKSIGVEIHNTGHSYNYPKFPKKQISSVLYLSKILKKKYKINRNNFIGHSDISPDRKKDPGEKFPWHFFSKHKIGLWDKSIYRKSIFRDKKISKINENLFLKYLKNLGYCNKLIKNLHNKKVIKAFQRHFRVAKIDGKIDRECFEIAKNLVKYS